jgi:aldehyde dehydrogenase (NAD+)
VIIDPSPTDGVMADEIFGPILPILTVESLDQAVAFVNARPKPLASYVFSFPRHGRSIVGRVPSGGAVIGQVAMHVWCHRCRLVVVGGQVVWAPADGRLLRTMGLEPLSHRRAVSSKPAKPDLRWSIRRTPTALKIIRRLF